ncbi:MAG: ATP-grasp domain-containing protein [Nocardioides sp.]
MKPRVLVTGVGGLAGRALVEQLVRGGIEVIGVDARVVQLTGVRTHQVPAASDPTMLDALRGIASAAGVTMLLPTVSEELPLLALERDSFPGVDVVVGDASPVALAHDKLLTMAVLGSAGVPVPRFGRPSDFASTAAALQALPGGLVVKPRVSRRAREVVAVQHPEDLDWATTTDEQLVQELAPGTQYAPVVYLSDPDSTAPALVVVLEKIGVDDGTAGNAVSVGRAGDEGRDVAAVALAAADTLGLHGPVDVDVRRLADGRPVVLEVNARFGAYSAAVPELLARVLERRPAARPTRTAL